MPEHLNRNIPVNQSPALGLRKTQLDVGSNCFALLHHLVFKIKAARV
jgi:hypothetical protein